MLCPLFKFGLYMNGGYYSPCSLVPSLGRFDNPDEFLNSGTYEEFVDKALEGELHKVCVRCLRRNEGSIHESISTNGLNISYGDGTRCGFACKSCRHSNLTYKSMSPEDRDKQQFELGSGNPSDLQWIKDNVCKISKVSIVGGDPTLSNRVCELLKFLSNYPDIDVHYNYNGDKLNFPNGVSLIEALSGIKSLEVSFSIDGFGDIFNTLRPGPSFRVVRANTIELMEALPQARFTICVTVSTMNFEHVFSNLPNFVDMYGDNVLVYLNEVITPEHLSPKHLPASLKVNLKRRYRKLKNINYTTIGYLYKQLIEMLE